MPYAQSGLEGFKIVAELHESQLWTKCHFLYTLLLRALRLVVERPWSKNSTDDVGVNECILIFIRSRACYAVSLHPVSEASSHHNVNRTNCCIDAERRGQRRLVMVLLEEREVA